MYIVFAILLLAVLIMIHEFGHFMAARIMKIDVMEFSIGFGPRLLGWKSRKYDTKFSVRAIPLGGYCAFYGEDDTEGITRDDPRAFPNHNVWKRMFVIVMGPMMNFLLAFVVTMVFVWCVGISVPVDGGYYPVIADVTEGGAAAGAGILKNDIVTEIDGTSMRKTDAEEAVSAFRDTVGGWQEGDEALRLSVLRDGAAVELRMTPRLTWDEDEGKNRMMIGVLLNAGIPTERRPATFGEGISEAWNICADAAGTILRLLKELPTNREVADSMTGVVGTVAVVQELTKEYGFEMFINLLIVISINLGLMNLLPIPGLDGSRLVFGIVEAIRGKPIPREKEAMVHMAGMVLLFGLMIFFTYNDIVRLVQGRLITGR